MKPYEIKNRSYFNDTVTLCIGGLQQYPADRENVRIRFLFRKVMNRPPNQIRFRQQKKQKRLNQRPNLCRVPSLRKRKVPQNQRVRKAVSQKSLSRLPYRLLLHRTSHRRKQKAKHQSLRRNRSTTAYTAC